MCLFFVVNYFVFVVNYFFLNIIMCCWNVGWWNIVLWQKGTIIITLKQEKAIGVCLLK